MDARRDFTDLLADPNFRVLLKQVTRRCISWDEFLGLPQPRDMSPLETWAVLSEINSCLAVAIPVPTLGGTAYSYRRTYEIDNAAASIAAACHTDSYLHRTLTAPSGHHFLVKSRIDRTVAAAALDGLDIPQADATLLLQLGRAPQSDTERLLVNMMRAFDQVPDLVDEPFSQALFKHLRDLLVDGVDLGSLSLRTPARGIPLALDAHGAESQQRVADPWMDRIAAYLNRESFDPDDLVVLQGPIMAEALRSYRPFGALSSHVGRLVSSLFAYKNKLPVLGVLSISRAKLDWETGAVKPPMVSFDQDMARVLSKRSPMDATVTQTLSAQLTLIALESLESHIETWNHHDETMRTLLVGDPLLNYRQRSILSRAIRDPETEFRIRFHQTNHDIHYTTARRDLLELHEKGYLVMEQRGKAFVFTRGPKLVELAVGGQR